VSKWTSNFILDVLSWELLTSALLADDLILIVRGDLPSVTHIQHCFNMFYMASGLKANLMKSSVYFARKRVLQNALVDFNLCNINFISISPLMALAYSE